METMLYKDFISNVNDSPILSQSDETVQAAVYDWFKYRRIGFKDTDKFLDILQRNVAINYPIYQQKLRIEPGVSTYDWLVQVYRERQLKVAGDSSNTTEYGGTHTNTKTGNDTNVRTGGVNAVRSGNDTNVRTGSQENVKTGNETNAMTGGHTVKDTEGTHTTTAAPHVEKVTTHGGHTSNWSGSMQVAASLPMSKTYDHQQVSVDKEDGVAIESTPDYFKSRAYQGMPSTSDTDPYNAKLDWSTVSSQSQGANRGYNVDKSTVTESYNYGDGVTGDISTRKGDSEDPDTHETTYNDETGTHTYNDVTDKQTYNDVTDTHTYNDVTDHTTYESVTDTHTYNSVTDTDKHTGTDTVTEKDNRLDQEQMTGRNEDPATILMRATAFIEMSSAFRWFKEQIDSCFYPGYYTEEECDGTEEGSALI